MTYKELNTGEPVAWMQTFTQEYQGVREIKNAVNIERIGINDSALYSQDYVTQLQQSIIDQQGYVNQLLGEIEVLKAQIKEFEAEKQKDFERKW